MQWCALAGIGLCLSPVVLEELRLNVVGVSNLLRRPLARHDVRLRPPAIPAVLRPALAHADGVFDRRVSPHPRTGKSHKWNRTKVSQMEPN